MGKQWKNEDIIFSEDAQRWENGVQQSLEENTLNAIELKHHTDDKNNPHGVNASQVGAYTKTEIDSRIATVKTEIINGNVASATKLQTARNINGNAFDGTKNIEVQANPQVNDIPMDTNLNNIKNAGFYGCPLSATVETLTNAPTKVAFSMVVINAGNESIVTQLLSEFNTTAGSKVYIRRCYNNSWGSWFPIASSDGTLQAELFAQSANRLATPRSISLTGGVTGSVAFDGSANVSLAATVPPNSHTHTIANVSGLQTTLDGKTNVRGHSNGTVTQISNSNLNDLIESGVFMGSTMTNAPDTGWWYVQNLVHNSNYVTQIAYRLNSTDQRIQIRIKNNGTWQAWQTFMLSTDNAPTATRLATPRTISLTGGVTGSVSFDGSSNVAMAATLSGNAPTATRLATPRSISLSGGVTGSTTFDGSGNVSIAATVAGNAPTATRLATARTIAGVSFDGTQNIALSANNVGAYTKSEVDSIVTNMANPSWIDVSQYLTSSFKTYSSSANSKVVIQFLNKTTLMIAGVVSPTKTLAFANNSQEYELVSIPKSTVGITGNWSFSPTVQQASGVQFWLLGMIGNTSNLIFNMARHRLGTTWTNCNAGDWLPFTGIARLV